jgi:hypothetical protein
MKNPGRTCARYGRGRRYKTIKAAAVTAHTRLGSLGSNVNLGMVSQIELAPRLSPVFGDKGVRHVGAVKTRFWIMRADGQGKLPPCPIICHESSPWGATSLMGLRRSVRTGHGQERRS